MSTYTVLKEAREWFNATRGDNVRKSMKEHKVRAHRATRRKVSQLMSCGDYEGILNVRYQLDKLDVS